MDNWQTWLAFFALIIALAIAVVRYRKQTPEPDAKIVDLVVFDEAADITEEQWNTPVKKLKQQKSRSRKDKQ